MRKPDDSFSSDLLRSFCVLDRLRYELTAAMFWLIERPMMKLLLDWGRSAHPWACHLDRQGRPRVKECVSTSFRGAVLVRIGGCGRRRKHRWRGSLRTARHRWCVDPVRRGYLP